MAKRFNLNTHVTMMLLGKLVQQNQAEKTPDGKYRAVNDTKIAAAQ
jgi:hypothetical protein